MTSVQKAKTEEHPITESIKYLTAKEAQDVDVELMSTLAFSLDQLMELAGLSVASAVAELYPPSSHPKVLVICGPGNNGGDGLVAARHLKHFGYEPEVLYPKPGKIELYKRLTIQCESLFIPIRTNLEDCAPEHAVVVDAIFGFSFDSSAEIRAPFPKILDDLVRRQATAKTVAVDIPSSWDVEKGDTKGLGVKPSCLVSLTAPKLCAKLFKGQYHMLGGRFVPPAIATKYQLNLPPYPGSSQCVALHNEDASKL